MWSEFIANNARFSLTDALDSAQCNYEDNFIEHWGLEAKAPPEWLEHNYWLECKRLYGLAKTVARSAMTLVRQRGVGPGRLTEGEHMHEDAKRFEEGLRQLMDVFNNSSRDAVISLLDEPYDPSDPRTRYWIFYNTLQIEAARFVAPRYFEWASWRSSFPAMR